MKSGAFVVINKTRSDRLKLPVLAAAALLSYFITNVKKKSHYTKNASHFNIGGRLFSFAVADWQVMWGGESVEIGGRGRAETGVRKRIFATGAFMREHPSLGVGARDRRAAWLRVGDWA